MKPAHPDSPLNYDINDKHPTETAAHEEPRTIDHEEFRDYCLDLYEVIKYGSRKKRKNAAKELVVMAVALEEAYIATAAELHKWHAPPPTDPPDREPIRPGTDAKLNPWHLPTDGAAPGANCVINEAAHGH